MTAYYVMSAIDAKRFLVERDEEDPVPLGDVQRVAGDGEAIVDQRPIDDLRDRLKVLLEDFPAELKRRDQQGGRFEQQGCEYVHQALSAYPVKVLADPDFWTWLTVAKFADIVEWRFGVQGRIAKLENYGIGKRAENLLFRMWLRGEIGFDEDNPDPYELARAGDQDLWRSHIIRQGYGNAREIAKALLRLQAGKLDHGRLSVDGIRELAKRLRRLHAKVFFEILPASRANALVLELSADL